MSTEFNIDLKEILKHGVVVTTKFNEKFNEVEETMIIPGYPYSRSCEICDKKLLVSCSGQFREWLKVWLTATNITYTTN